MCKNQRGLHTWAKVRILAFLFFFYVSTSFAWNSVGHRLIAQIAYDQLDVQPKKTLNAYNRAMDRSFAARSLILAAIWLDTLHRQTQYAYLSHLHYIDLPYSRDGSVWPAPEEENALSAISLALQNFQKPASLYERGLSLRILLHVIADIHQPLHTITCYSQQHPKGDRGGNLFRLAANPVASNLHAYWDRGGGYLLGKKKSKSSIKKWAKRLEKRWPCTQNSLINPKAWVHESYQIAVHEAYAIEPYTRPSSTYQRRVKKRSEQQIALAGCRLGQVLNQLTLG